MILLTTCLSGAIIVLLCLFFHDVVVVDCVKTSDDCEVIPR
jgi:hypothetical protein